MREKLTAKTFSDFLNDKFKIYFDPSLPSVLELIEVSEINFSSKTSEMEPFSLVFRGSIECEWPQGMYKIEHKSLKELQLFLVPIGPDNKGQCFEAVFN